MAEEIEQFIGALRGALDDATFVRLTLGKYRGDGESRKLVVSLVTIKGLPHLRFVTSKGRSDATENYNIDSGMVRISELCGTDYLSATVFTTRADVTLAFNKKKEASLSHSKATFKTAPDSTDHNRAKNYIVDSSRPYLKALGITQDDGSVKPSMYAKFKQICRFVEIIDGLVREAPLPPGQDPSVIDIGSGKGYLTFAVYEHLTAVFGKGTRVTGIEVRSDLASRSAAIARKLQMQGLEFDATEAAAIQQRADIVIALHACDTATDDAMAQGVAGDAAIIVCAPCCQHELAPQLSRPAQELSGLMKFGLFAQRQADLLTDAARCLLLEAVGYNVKVIEFVSTEHTAKNILIAAVKSEHVARTAAFNQYLALKSFMGFQNQRLEMRLRSLGRIAET